VGVESGGSRDRQPLLPGVRGPGAEFVSSCRRQRRVEVNFRSVSGRRRLSHLGRRHGPGDGQCGRSLEFGNRLGGWRRWYFAERICDSIMANRNSRRLHQLFPNLAQRPGRFCQREFHLLRVRRPVCMHGELLWRDQFCRAPVGRLPGPRQSAGALERPAHARFHQSEPLFDRIELELRCRFPRHHQRQQRRFRHCRIRSGNRLGQPQRRGIDQCPCGPGCARLHSVRVSRFGLRGAGQLRNLHDHQRRDGRLRLRSFARRERSARGCHRELRHQPHRCAGLRDLGHDNHRGIPHGRRHVPDYGDGNLRKHHRNCDSLSHSDCARASGL